MRHSLCQWSCMYLVWKMYSLSCVNLEGSFFKMFTEEKVQNTDKRFSNVLGQGGSQTKILIFAEETCRHATVLESGDHLQVAQAVRKSLYLPCFVPLEHALIIPFLPLV